MELINHKLKKNVEVYADVGHNIDAIVTFYNLSIFQKRVIAGLEGKLYCIYGTSAQKDAKPILEEFERKFKCTYLVEAKHFRSMKIELLRELA